jgi:hypothetical protein
VGLDTRFLFYQSVGDTSWRNVFEMPDILPEVAYTNMAIELASFVGRYQCFEPDATEIQFSFTTRQQAKFHEWFTKKNDQLLNLHGAEFSGSIRRLGLSYFRCCMVLSIIRGMDTMEKQNTIWCNDEDFDTAQSIIECLMNHSSQVFMRLKAAKGQARKHLKRKEQQKAIDIYWEKLPDNFARKEAVEYAALLGINDKTSGSYLDKYIQQGKLDRVSHGSYVKC